MRTSKLQLGTAVPTQQEGSSHLFSYSTLDTISPKVEGLMLRSSRSLYRLCRNFSRWYLQENRATLIKSDRRRLGSYMACMAKALLRLQTACKHTVGGSLHGLQSPVKHAQVQGYAPCTRESTQGKRETRLTWSARPCRALRGQCTACRGSCTPFCSRWPASGTAPRSAGRCRWPRTPRPPWPQWRHHCTRKSAAGGSS